MYNVELLVYFCTFYAFKKTCATFDYKFNLGRRKIKEEDLIPLLETAAFLQSEKAIKIISQYMYGNLSLKNYFIYYKLTKLYRLKSLNKFLCNTLLQQHILKEDAKTFYKLSFEDLCEIFSCNELEISSELQLFNAAVDWINYNKVKRSKHMKKFLKLIRLPLLTDEIITDIIKNHKICKSCMTCQDIVVKAIKMKNKSKRKAFDLQFQNRFFSREFETCKLMIVGAKFKGYSKRLYKTAAEFELVKNHIRKVGTTSEMLVPRKECEVAVIGSKIYCFGGTNSDDESLISCEVYCRKTMTWSSIASLPKIVRSTFGTCVCSFMNKIYLFEGYSNWVYDPSLNSWQEIAKVNLKRKESSCAVFQGQCTVLGGLNFGLEESRRKIFKTVETYDHYLDKWTFLPNMQIARSAPGIVAKGNKLYVIAGTNEYFNSIKASEVYDSISKQFTFIASNQSYWSCGSFCFYLNENKIVVNNYFIYDIKSNEWSESTYTISDMYKYSCVKLNKLIL